MAKITVYTSIMLDEKEMQLLMEALKIAIGSTSPGLTLRNCIESLLGEISINEINIDA